MDQGRNFVKNEMRTLSENVPTPAVMSLSRKRESGKGRRRNYTTVLCRSIHVRSTSSIGWLHQCSEKISISE